MQESTAKKVEAGANVLVALGKLTMLVPLLVIFGFIAYALLR